MRCSFLSLIFLGLVASIAASNESPLSRLNGPTSDSNVREAAAEVSRGAPDSAGPELIAKVAGDGLLPDKISDKLASKVKVFMPELEDLTPSLNYLLSVAKAALRGTSNGAKIVYIPGASIAAKGIDVVAVSATTYRGEMTVHYYYHQDRLRYTIQDPETKTFIRIACGLSDKDMVMASKKILKHKHLARAVSWLNNAWGDSLGGELRTALNMAACGFDHPDINVSYSPFIAGDTL